MGIPALFIRQSIGSVEKLTKRKRRWTVSGALAALLGFVCAAVLGALLYGAMVYQLAGEQAADAAPQENAGGVLTLGGGVMTDESIAQENVGGALCTVIRRTYLLESGVQALAVTAEPAAYLERLAAPGVQMQLITGFVIDGMDALYAVSGDTGILAARSEDTVYMIEAPNDQQALYELGAGARRDE